jgi:hypothetical protein
MHFAAQVLNSNQVGKQMFFGGFDLAGILA